MDARLFVRKLKNNVARAARASHCAHEGADPGALPGDVGDIVTLMREIADRRER